MVDIKKFFNKFAGILTLVLSLPAAAALFVKGFYGASDDLHIAWLFEMDKTLSLGQIPPRFVPDLSFGFGYPLFNFVFPLPFYIGEIFHFLNFSLVDSVKIVFGLSLVLSSLAMFLLLRHLTSPLISLAGALLYLYTPYRSTDVYVRGALGESLAFVFLPICLLACLKILNKESRWIGWGALAIAGLILSHNITTYMFLPFIVLFVIVNLFIKKIYKTKIAFNLGVMFILGLGVSLYFWLPALLDSSLMKYDTVFNYIDHFPTLRQLFTPGFSYGASVPGPYDGMSFFIGIVNLIVIVLGFILLIWQWKKLNFSKKLLLIWSLLVFVLSLFMMNYRSALFWDNLPLIPYFQFPWRFLILVTFVSPLFLITLEEIKYKNIIALLIVLGSISLNINILRPHDFLAREDSYYINRYIPTPTASQEYLTTQEEYLRLPIKTLQRPNQNYPLIFPENDVVQSIQKENDLKISFQTMTNQEVKLNFSKYYFPGWKGELDGQPLKLEAGEPFGQITFIVPSGHHQIKLFFTETPFKISLDLISLGALLISLYLLASKKLMKLSLD